MERSALVNTTDKRIVCIEYVAICMRISKLIHSWGTKELLSLENLIYTQPPHSTLNGNCHAIKFALRSSQNNWTI